MEYTKNSVFKQGFQEDEKELNIKEYFSEYRNLLPTIPEDAAAKKDFCRDFVGVSDVDSKTIANLEEDTSVDLLDCENEPLQIESTIQDRKEAFELMYREEPEDATQISSSLTSLREIQCMREKNGHNTNYFWLKYRNCQWLDFKIDPRGIRTIKVEKHDVIGVHIRIYQPYISVKSEPYKIKLQEELLVLSDQNLCAVRDKIRCSMDYTGIDDISDDMSLRDVCSKRLPKDVYRSGFFFIEGTFYIDQRYRDMLDTSAVIVRWAESRGIGPFNVTSMEHTLVQDLKIVLGKPYVYQHQGNCEHVIIFSDVRFLNSDDTPRRTSYPRRVCIGRQHAKGCMMCGVNYAGWIVRKSTRLPHDMAYFCDRCFVSYHYVDGAKVGDFQAYKYVDPVSLF